MALPDFTQIDFTIKFNGNNDPKDITLTDNTTFGSIGGGIDNTKVVMSLYAEHPDDTVITNNAITSPDIDPDVNTTADFSVSLQSSGQFEQGEYYFKYLYRLTNYLFNETPADSYIGGGSGDDWIELDGDYTPYLSVSDTVTATGGTPGTLTVDSISYNGTRTKIYWGEDITVAPSAITWTVATIDGYNEKTFTLDFTETLGNVTGTYSCKDDWFKAVDDTDYYSGTYSSSISRTLTIKYPPDILPSVPADATSSTESKTITAIYTGNYTINLDVTVTWTLSAGFEYAQDVDVSEGVFVKCFELYSKMKCGYKKLLAKHETNLSSGTETQIAETERSLNRVNSHVAMYDSYKNAGEHDNAQAKAQEILDLLDDCNCTCDDCGEDEGKPVLVSTLEL